VAGSAPVCAVAGLPGRGPEYPRRVVTDTTPDSREGISAIKLGEVTTILDLHRQGLSVSAIGKQIGYGSQDGEQVHRAGARGSETWPAQAKRNGGRPARDLSSRTREGLFRPDSTAAFPRDLGSRPFLQLYSAIRADKVTGLETGVRNYITRPFALPEFLARVRAALRGPLERHCNRIFHFDVWRVGAACIEEINSSSLRVHSSDGLSRKSVSSRMSSFWGSCASMLKSFLERSNDVQILRLRRKLGQHTGSSAQYNRTGRGVDHVFDSVVKLKS